MLQFDSSELNRCHYRDSAGRRCRLPRQQGHPTFCSRHVRPEADPAYDFSHGLLGPLNDFRSMTSINYVLGRLLILKAAGAISARDASVVTYICQLLAQTIPYVRKEVTWSRGHDPEDLSLRSVLQATSSVWNDPDDTSAPKASAAPRRPEPAPASRK